MRNDANRTDRPASGPVGARPAAARHGRPPPPPSATTNASTSPASSANGPTNAKPPNGSSWGFRVCIGRLKSWISRRNRTAPSFPRRRECIVEWSIATAARDSDTSQHKQTEGTLMQRRSLLRRHLSEAWRETICHQYRSGLINSERGLQVYFCSELLKRFDDAKNVKRRIFVEPHVAATDGELGRSGKSSWYPDVVICDSQKIIGVVELKYLPRSRPKWRKDIHTLQFIASHPGGLAIANDRFLGEASVRNYPLVPNAVLCWASVYRERKLDLRSEISDPLRERFLQLHALTQDGEPPRIVIDQREQYCYPGGRMAGA